MYSENNIRRSWVEINLSQLKENYLNYKKYLSSKNEVIAVVKADAYGHGDVKICQTLMELGVRFFAVSNLEEAKLLRKNNIKGEILILGYTPIKYVSELVKYDITQTLISEEYAELVANTGVYIKCQFAIDTGMNRIGLNAADISRCEKVIRKYYSLLDLKGIFTHLSVADSEKKEDKAFTELQVFKFKNLVQRIKNLKNFSAHFSNSIGGLIYTKDSLIVRLGIILYGIKPSPLSNLPIEIRPILSWKSVISMIKSIEEKESIGYGRTFIASRKMWIATIPTGYADGYNRKFSNNGYVLIKGYKAPIVGQICMDQMMVDVTDIVIDRKEKLGIGEEVVLIGHSGKEVIDVNELASKIDTIGYEIICNISKRVPRIYR